MSFSKGLVLACLLGLANPLAAFEPICVSPDGKQFIRKESGDPFVVWGVNYDHDRSGQLLDEYWIAEWDTVVEDFAEIKSLGANCVRVHLQVGKFLDAPDRPNQAALEQLKKILQLAEENELYLDITGLACYHKKNIPPWFDALSEEDRWKSQAVFWKAIAKTCKDSPAVFCYDLMNEPILPGKDPATEWLGGELAGKFFVQRIALETKGRTRQQVAEAWVGQMVDAIRSEDPDHMVTIGVIPWVFVFGGGKPLFHAPPVSDRLDFAAVHFYPKKGKVDEAIKALKAYDLGKPLVVEEMFPLGCSKEELTQFVNESRPFCDGWISFYWGATSKELAASEEPTMAEAITASWLDEFKRLGKEVLETP